MKFISLAIVLVSTPATVLATPDECSQKLQTYEDALKIVAETEIIESQEREQAALKLKYLRKMREAQTDCSALTKVADLMKATLPTS